MTFTGDIPLLASGAKSAGPAISGRTILILARFASIFAIAELNR